MSEPTKKKHRASLLCRSEVKKYAYSRATEHSRVFKGVSEKFYDQLEAKLKVVINDAVFRHPSCLKRLTDVPQGFI
jgi:hypothetical protein